MSEDIRLEKSCMQAADTENFGEVLGSKLQGGEVIELQGDVGAGKTTFVKGLARGLGSKDHVSSPTFTISNLYKGRVPLYHFDFYRLPEPGLVANALEEEVTEHDAVVVIEWAETVRDILPVGRIIIRFNSTGDTNRQLIITAPAGLSYIGENV
jgi:tRNA threonylcarbamoyladenosine biosynthesis protein TsaE